MVNKSSICKYTTLGHNCLVSTLSPLVDGKQLRGKINGSFHCWLICWLFSQFPSPRWRPQMFYPQPKSYLLSHLRSWNQRTFLKKGQPVDQSFCSGSHPRHRTSRLLFSFFKSLLTSSIFNCVCLNINKLSNASVARTRSCIAEENRNTSSANATLHYLTFCQSVGKIGLFLGAAFTFVGGRLVWGNGDTWCKSCQFDWITNRFPWWWIIFFKVSFRLLNRISRFPY